MGPASPVAAWSVDCCHQPAPPRGGYRRDFGSGGSVDASYWTAEREQTGTGQEILSGKTTVAVAARNTIAARWWNTGTAR